jgi:DNA primase
VQGGRRRVQVRPGDGEGRIPRGGGAALAPRRASRCPSAAPASAASAPAARGAGRRATAYEQWLGDPDIGAQARAYLERRGIARETQRSFRLGLAPAGWEGLVGRLRGRFSDEVLLEARLAGRKEGGRSTFDWFRNRLMVPLVAPGGAVLGFGARAFGDEQPKYLNSPESAVYHKGQFSLRARTGA